MGKLTAYDVEGYSPGAGPNAGAAVVKAHDVAGHLKAKGFCVIKADVPYDVRQAALNEALALHEQGVFERLPKELLNGFFGSVGSAWCKKLAAPNDAGPGEDKLRIIEKYIDDLGAELLCSTSEAYYGMTLACKTMSRLHLSKSVSDPTAPSLNDPDQADQYMNLFCRKRVTAIFYAGPGLAWMNIVPIDHVLDFYKTQIQPGTVVLVRGDACRCRIEPKTMEQGLTMAIDFLAQRRHQVQEMARDSVQPPRDFEIWYLERMKAIVDNEVMKNVPEHWQRHARQLFYKTPPVGIASIDLKLPSAVEESGDRHPFVASVLSGADCIEAIPATKWDVDAYYDADPLSVDDFKMYTKHMGVVDTSFFTGPAFDAREFGMTPEEARAAGPRHLMLSQSATQCLKKGGVERADIEGTDMGIFCGLSGNDMYYAMAAKQVKLSKTLSAGLSNSASVNRVAFMFGSTGPCICVDTEDSSGSVALDTAVTYTRGGKCAPRAIVGVADHIRHPFSLVMLCAAGLMTRTGRSRVFDESSDGFIRSDGFLSLLLELRSASKGPLSSGEDPTSDHFGFVTGSAVNSKGISSGLTAPSSSAIGDVLSRAYKDAASPASVLDAVEVHATGNAIADGVEYGIVVKSIVSQEAKPSAVLLRNAASSLGSTGPCGGLSSVARALLQMEKALHGPCLHLRQFFEMGTSAVHDYEDQGLVAAPRHHVATELVGAAMHRQTVGVASFGGSGTNVYHVLWGQAPPSKFPGRPGRALAWFPSNRPELTRPSTGYYICGTWSGWTARSEMEPEGQGAYGYTVTMGENMWESFLIYADKDDPQVLHPEAHWASKESKALGPDNVGRVSVWHIDARTRHVRMANEEQKAALDAKVAKALKNGQMPEEPDHRVVACFKGNFKPAGCEKVADYSGMPLSSITPEDIGVPGDKYRVRLFSRGAYKWVTWAKLPKDAPASEPVQNYLPQYFITGDHNYWDFQQMVREAPGSGTVCAAEVQLLRESSTFQIIRDKDWDQAFYPRYPQLTATKADCSGAEIKGPDGDGIFMKWELKGKVGDIFKVEFRRSVEVDGTDTKRALSWKLLRNEWPNFAELTKEHRYSIVGSWSDFRDLYPMEFEEEAKVWSGTFQLGSTGQEEFIILLNDNWLSAVHPQEPKSSCWDARHQLQGPDDRGDGKCWLVGKTSHDKLSPGDLVRVALSMDENHLPKRISWAKVPG